ncbi:Modification methylase DpnIIB [Thalassoglobus neptunius]|uniref:Methyltransferase n=1 Tax=Thalassoglobus neptunius TaxID=1938619 RepID=A0A5C5WMG6_9PLAN|nr:DNA methyltransferase [Thalassoglobus neptunius]TWT51817.1 Modification methylase DpnIIB [Thalassoglobus neptunius]
MIDADWSSECGTIQLWNRDCRELPELLSLADAVVSDPPYGMNWNTDGSRYTRGGNKKEGRVWSKIEGDSEPFNPEPWLECEKVILWGSNHFSQRLPVGTTLVWIKKTDSQFGCFLSDAELAWMSEGHGVYCFRDTSMHHPNVKDRVHPTQKPIGLMRWCLEKLKLQPGMTVFDPYSGSGTTAIAAHSLGINFVGCEISPEFFKASVKRISKRIGERVEVQGGLYQGSLFGGNN